MKFIRLAKEMLAGHPIICDIGSRDAQEGISLMKQLNGKELHVFEPNPSAAQTCRQNLEKFTSEGLGKIAIFNQVAVTDRIGELPFYPVNVSLSENKDSGFSSLLPINPDYTKTRGRIVQGQVVVNATTLDEYFRDQGAAGSAVDRCRGGGITGFARRGAGPSRCDASAYRSLFPADADRKAFVLGNF